jgi:iron complex outermembrane receptor protein
MYTNARKPLAAIVAAIAAASTPVLAQTGPIEEVVVTAQKRTESLTDVPISIGVMTAEALEKTGVRQLREVAEFVPNLTVSNGNDSSTAVRIRGVGTNTRNIGFDTRVGVYVDGVYMGQSLAQNLDILDLERIEVVRGPQGTQFGRNTVAGAINMISNKPSDEFELQLLGEVGNYSSHRVGAVLNVPLSDNLAGRFSVVDHGRDGLVDNITTGTKHNERDGTSFRGQLAFSGENFTATLAADYLESDRVSFFGEAVSDWSGSVPNTEAPGRFDIANDFDNYEKREIWGTSLNVDVALGDYSLTSITAYRDNSIDRRPGHGPQLRSTPVRRVSRCLRADHAGIPAVFPGYGPPEVHRRPVSVP